MLSHVLRDVWGFDGYITSDTDAVGDIYKEHHYSASVPASVCDAIVNGTCDINSGGTYMDNLLQAVKAGGSQLGTAHSPMIKPPVAPLTTSTGLVLSA